MTFFFLPSMRSGGLPSLGRRVRSECLAAPDGLQAGRSRSVRRAAGQHGRARARERGRRAQKRETEPVLGLSRGGFRSQLHMLADRQSRPLRLRVTSGQRHDNTQIRARVAIWTNAPPILSDRGPGLMTATPCAHGWRSRISRPSFRPRSGARTPSPATRYPARNIVERGIGWLKRGRRVATRYAIRVALPSTPSD